jgi:hypothetical protein
MVPWASRLTNDLVPETGYPAPRVVVLFQAVADRWSGSSYDDVTIRLAAGIMPLASGTARSAKEVPGYSANSADNTKLPIRTTYVNAGAISVPVNCPYVTGVTNDLLSGYVWNFNPADGGARYVSTGYVIEMLELCRYCGPSTSAGLLDFTADSRSRFLSVDSGVTDIAQFGGGKKFSDAGQAGYGKDESGMEIGDPGAPAGRWLRLGIGDFAALDAIGWNTLEKSPGADRFALCLIGLLAIVPSLLLRRAEMGRKRSGHCRRSQTGPVRIA